MQPSSSYAGHAPEEQFQGHAETMQPSACATPSMLLLYVRTTWSAMKFVQQSPPSAVWKRPLSSL